MTGHKRQIKKAPPVRQCFAIANPEPLAAEFGVGKWSRIATYGKKRQEQPDGTWFETVFDDAKFEQGLRNFRTMFAARGKGMGSDCEHQTLYAPVNGQPAKNPAYFTALAWVKDGQVRGLEVLREGIPEIEPAAEAARLKELYPKAADHSPDGTWAFCAEVTDYGREVIPSYSQLSPLFKEKEYDEAGKLLGFAWLNVSFVNVAHQTGTNFAFGKRNRMADISHEEMLKKLSHHGLSESPKAEDYEKALGAYMADTDDAKDVRASMAKACAKAMGELEIVHHDEDEDDDELSDEQVREKLEEHGLGEEPGPEHYKKALAAYMAKTEDPKPMRAAMAKACAKAMSGEGGPSDKGLSTVVQAMSRRNELLTRQVEELQTERKNRELAEVVADAKSRGLTEADAKSFYQQFGKAGALSWLGKFPRKGQGMGKWGIGGADNKAPPEGSTIETVNGVRVIGRGLSQVAKEILTKGEAKTIKDAQALAVKRFPHLYGPTTQNQ